MQPEVGRIRGWEDKTEEEAAEIRRKGTGRTNRNQEENSGQCAGSRMFLEEHTGRQVEQAPER